MKIGKTNRFKLGIFVIAGIVIFILGIYLLGKQQNLFRSTLTVLTEFNNVKGLQVGNSVRFLGINAGSVSDISISNDTLVMVEMEIDRKLSQYIREDSKVEIENEGVMGTKIITIQPGTSAAPPIKEDFILSSVSSLTIEEIFGALEGTVDYSTEAAKNLMEVTEKIKNGKGALGKLVNDPTLTESFEKLGVNLIDITEGTKAIVEKANRGDNDLSTLLNQDKITTKLNELLTDADTIAENFKSSAREIDQTSFQINYGEGLVNKLLYDSAFAEDVDTTVVKVKNSVDEIEDVSDKIQGSWILNLFSGEKKEKRKKKREDDGP